MKSDKGVSQFSPPPPPQGAAPAPSKATAAPFRVAIPVPSWQRARDQTCAAVLAGEMCVVVTGLPGTGKTLLVETVARALRSTGWKVNTFVARLPSDQEFAALTGSAAILIDDADRLSGTELRTLNRLRQCSVLLAGAVGLEKRCPADSRVTLAPLSPDEVATYVELWLAQAGHDPDLVAETAIEQLADVSAGIPRVLGILLAASLKSARADGAAQIEDRHVDHAAWHHVESTAARRLHRATSSAPPAPKHVTPAPAIRAVDLEKRLSQAPFADESGTDQPRSLLGTRALGIAGFTAAFALTVAAGLLTSRHWPRWAMSASNLARDNPAPAPNLARAPAPIPAQADTPTAPASLSLPEPAATNATPPAEQPGPPATTGSVPPAAVLPPAVPVQAQVPAELAPSLPPPSLPPAGPATVDVRPAPIAQAVAAKAETSLPARAAPDLLSPEIVSLLNQRGLQMIELNDYSAARLLFSRAAEAGSVTAMLALGRSYDPNVAGRAGSVADVDSAQAAQWYRRAAASGSSDAAMLLQQLERGPRE